VNIGQPLPDPRTAVINDLSAQIDSFFAAGRTVRVIESGVSGERTGGQSMATHHDRMRAERDKLAPTVQYLASEGKSIKEAAEALATVPKRVKLIARENGIKFAK
jgi:hypothetical protein